ncbi:MAG TPA: hypothetical protein VJS42_00830 [Steroidobacteraceae bacterium]|nr:hypothetical protein [Steroidobacteraceae bacterium]
MTTSAKPSKPVASRSRRHRRRHDNESSLYESLAAFVCAGVQGQSKSLRVLTLNPDEQGLSGTLAGNGTQWLLPQRGSDDGTHVMFYSQQGYFAEGSYFGESVKGHVIIETILRRALRWSTHRVDERRKIVAANAIMITPHRMCEWTASWPT